MSDLNFLQLCRLWAYYREVWQASADKDLVYIFNVIADHAFNRLDADMLSFSVLTSGLAKKSR